MNSKRKRKRSVVQVRRKRRPRKFLSERILVEARLLAKRAAGGEFTIVELSKIVGISPATFYDHFGSKLELEKAIDLSS